MSHRTIAMWSAPRSLSTALMRAWEARPDTAVWDEPLYPAYLRETRQGHPAAQEVLATYESDWRTIVSRMLQPPPSGRSIYYHKHISHLYLDSMGTDWLSQVSHAFLIREPRAQLASLIKKWPDATLQQTGMPRLREIFYEIREITGSTPPVIDARDLQTDPKQTLETLCGALDVPYSDSMLAWPQGRRTTDGLWASHWYDSVETSTGFRSYSPPSMPIPERFLDMLGICEEIYEELSAYKLSRIAHSAPVRTQVDRTPHRS